MNKTGEKMLDILKELRDDLNCYAVKAEFEAEGSRTEELIMLSEVINRAEMPLTIKIGGCEAVRDLDQCKLLGAKAIMGPMIETPFAMSKFMGAAKKVYGDDIDTIDWIINTETITCYNNMDAIFDQGKGFLKTIGIGRVDLSSSIGLARKDINNEKMFELSSTFAKHARDHGLIVCFGGGISFDAVPFILQMAPIADRFETRKITFNICDDEKKIKLGILRAMEFEVLYLQNKCEYYDNMANEDRERFKMMTKRVEDARGMLG